MADSPPTPGPFSTPKRKRAEFVANDSPSPLSASFSFDVKGPTSVPTSGSSSPRTKVAHRFRGLALTDLGPASSPASGPAAQTHGSGLGGGGVASAAPTVHAHRDNDNAKPAQPSDRDSMDVDENETIMRKRPRLSPSPDITVAPPWPAEPVQAQAAVPEIPDARKNHLPTIANLTTQAPQQFSPVLSDEPANPSTLNHLVLDQAILSSSPKASPSKLVTQALSASSDRPLEAVKSRVRKRAGTPPFLGTNTKPSNPGQTAETAAQIIDPIRAALTWREDEITVYDPEDEDDDGVGINGIGFKPTPAVAYARTMRRRQQLAEYKKREEREARARRNLRRRASPVRALPPIETKDSGARKVHFTETEPSMMIETI